LALANAILGRHLGLKGKHVYTGNTNDFELQLMYCFTYVDGVMTLKLPSGKLIKSNLNQPKPLAPEIPPVFEGPPASKTPSVPEVLPEGPPASKTPLVPEVPPEGLPASKTPLVPEVPPEGPPDIKPIDPMYNITHLMDNIAHPDDSPLLTQCP